MKALIIIDLQNDFCPGGALEVSNGDQIIPVINKLSEHFDIVIQTQDWHPSRHSSFASSHEEKQPYDTIEMSYGTQVLWPDHCIQGTTGAEFHPELVIQNTQLNVRKGFRKEIDSYSAFYENDGTTTTGLAGYLRERQVDHLFLTGLALDFCVKWSALDGLKEGFGVTVIEDAVKGIDMNGSVDQAWDEMKEAGAKRVSSNKLL